MSARTLGLFALLLALLPIGCKVYVASKLAPSEISDSDIVTEVVTIDGRRILFDDDGGRLVAATDSASRGLPRRSRFRIRGLSAGKQTMNLPIDSVLYVRADVVDGVASTVLTIVTAAVPVGALLVAAVAAGSCPYVYSYDGSEWHFDAEPLGGSVCEGLKKTDYSRLEHLREVDGEYRLLIRNVMDESQHLDEISLLVVDHAPGTEATSDLAGTIHLITSPVAATRAVDEHGRDLLPLLRATDGAAWVSSPDIDTTTTARLRTRLTLTFDRPAGARTAKLVVNAGTTPWGAMMVRRMLELRGDRAERWCNAVTNGEREAYDLYRFNEREELYFLKVFVRTADGWTQKGFISGGGPFSIEEKVVTLDLTEVVGDVIEVRVDPPIGFWTIDHVALEVADAVAEARPLTATSAIDHNGKDVARLIRDVDRQYLTLPLTSDSTIVEFDAPPPPRDGMVRTVFLKSNGWYDVHIDRTRPEQTERLRELTETPGAIIRFSSREHAKWRVN